MKINIVTVNSGWILQKISERIVAASPDVFQISLRPVIDADANFYIDMLNCYRGKSPIFDIGFFTHLHEDSTSSMQNHWLSLDHIVHMCTRYKKSFQQLYPAEKMSVLYPGEVSEQFPIKKPLIGVFQRGFHEGKGFDFMKSIAQYDILKNFKLLFVDILLVSLLPERLPKVMLDYFFDFIILFCACDLYLILFSSGSFA